MVELPSSVVVPRTVAVIVAIIDVFIAVAKNQVSFWNPRIKFTTKEDV